MFQIKNINGHARLGILDMQAFAASKALLVKREIEQQASLYLLQQMLNNQASKWLTYTPENKPFLLNRPEHISISHSHDKLVLMVDEKQNCGVDIELIRDKVLKIKHKFLSDNELARAGNNIEKLIEYWAAKETLYKIYGKKGLDFAQHLFVEDLNADEMLAHIHLGTHKASYLLRKEKIEDYILVYSLREI